MKDRWLNLRDMIPTTPIACRIWRNSNLSVPVSASWLDFTWNTAAYQTRPFWTSGATVTIPLPGYYQVFVESTFDTSGLIGSPNCFMQVLLNGSTVIGDDTKMLILGASVPLFVMAMRKFSAGDTITVQVKHGNTAALNVLTQGDHSPDIICTRITG